MKPTLSLNGSTDTTDLLSDISLVLEPQQVRQLLELLSLAVQCPECGTMESLPKLLVSVVTGLKMHVAFSTGQVPAPHSHSASNVSALISLPANPASRLLQLDGD